jgi:hypothetical protein
MKQGKKEDFHYKLEKYEDLLDCD